MNILIILLRLRGGVGRANTEIAKALRKKGHKVDILSREDNLRKNSFPTSILSLRKKVRELVLKKEYDIIYTQDWSIILPFLLPYPLFWKKHFSCFCGIESIPLSNILQKIVGAIMGKKLVVIGDKLKKIFPKATLIYRGINLEKFKPLNKKRNSIGWYSSGNEIISIEEIKKISKETKLKLLVAEKIPPDKMNDFYNKCKVFINLPRTAGFNLSWLEAMAAGVPIIIGNYEGAGSFLPIDKISGNEDRVKEITKIIKNPKEINCRKWLIDNNFAWEKKADELIKFFEENLKKNV